VATAAARRWKLKSTEANEVVTDRKVWLSASTFVPFVSFCKSSGQPPMAEAEGFNAKAQSRYSGQMSLAPSRLGVLALK
jgi:hypothetical protein